MKYLCKWKKSYGWIVHVFVNVKKTKRKQWKTQLLHYVFHFYLYEWTIYFSLAYLGGGLSASERSPPRPERWRLSCYHSRCYWTRDCRSETTVSTAKGEEGERERNMSMCGEKQETESDRVRLSGCIPLLVNINSLKGCTQTSECHMTELEGGRTSCFCAGYEDLENFA